MDFEERINRLAERHEALAQSLEMLTIDIRELQVLSREFQLRLSTMTDGIDKLLRIAEIQHKRLTRLEQGEA